MPGTKVNRMPDRTFVIIRPRPLTAEQHEEQVINTAALFERLEGDLGLLQEVTHLFLATYPTLLAGIHETIMHCDSTELERLALTLKGMVSNLGATAAAAAALRLEVLSGQGNLEGAFAAYRVLVQALERFAYALQTISQATQ